MAAQVKTVCMRNFLKFFRSPMTHFGRNSELIPVYGKSLMGSVLRHCGTCNDNSTPCAHAHWLNKDCKGSQMQFDAAGDHFAQNSRFKNLWRENRFLPIASSSTNEEGAESLVEKLQSQSTFRQCSLNYKVTFDDR